MKVNEIFSSLQGEGITIGLPTIFIRLTGCNLNCEWCDTGYAREEGQELSVSDLLNELQTNYHQYRHICVTGGEPLVQLSQLPELLERLLSHQYEVVLETNGSVELESLAEILKKGSITLAVDVKTPSSGEQDSFLMENLKHISADDMLKFVLKDEQDYEFTKQFIQNHTPHCNIILTPVDGTNLKWLADRVLKDGLQVQVLPQLHKIIWGPRARGK